MRSLFKARQEHFQYRVLETGEAYIPFSYFYNRLLCLDVPHGFTTQRFTTYSSNAAFRLTRWKLK